ncbi:ABC transporter substrate-binding protein [Humidisolicoccus flavus]|uniref:ABC transporter substrate-binding protein n=1 Tax=Humidisolicoccus flavus TaxID=3111414 RepID=UPI00324BBF83
MKAFLRSSETKKSQKLGLSVLAGASIFMLAACSTGGGGETSTDPSTEPSTSSAAPVGSDTAHVDGVLKIGTILPQTGNLAFLGPPEFAGVDLAAADIEAADYEFEVEILHRDSGDTTTQIAIQSATDLINQDVDVVIGAASSGVSFTFINQLVEANVIQISPANTSPDFTTYEDNGIFWRTAPSDVLQGRVLGNLMVQDGAESVGFIYVNDPYGIGLEANASEAIEAAGGEVVASIPYNPGETSFTTQVDELISSGATAVGVLAFQETASIIPELVNTQGFPASGVYFVDGNLSNDYDFPAGTLEGAKGTLPGNPADDSFQARLLEVDPNLNDFSYAAESYDAVIVAALAAAQGGSDDAETIKANMQSVTTGGTKCTSFAECYDLIKAGEDIDYDGVSGPIEFDENGDPTEAYIGIYQYGADNKYTLLNAEFGSLNE